MLQYNAADEILSDLWLEYEKHAGDSPDTLHRLGRSYLPYIDQYGLDGRSAGIIRGIAQFHDDEELDLNRRLLREAYERRERQIKRERKEYDEFCMHFSGPARRAMLMLPEYVFGKVIPYRIKNQCLKIEIADNAAMELSLCFDGLLIEDGRHPKEIAFHRFSGERITQPRRVPARGPGGQMAEVPAYRFSFVNELGKEKYPSRVNSFTCADVSGVLRFYDYTSYPGHLDILDEKIAWKRIYNILDSCIQKTEMLGIGCLNEQEIECLPLFRVFHELTGLYTDSNTKTAAAASQVSFDVRKADAMKLEPADVQNVCSMLRPHGFRRLTEELLKMQQDRAAFYRFWIQYASTKRSAHLYRFLMERLGACSGEYRRHPLPLAYRKFHSMLQRMFDLEMHSRGWQGEFPCFYRPGGNAPAPSPKLYSKKYDYHNDKKKSYYVDFLDSVDGDTCSMIALTGEIILRADEEASDFCALDGCFADGGRRKSSVFGRIEMDSGSDAEQILNAAAGMAAAITKIVRGAADHV